LTNLGSKRLLIIDDDPKVTSRFEEALALNGFVGDVENDALIGLSTYKNDIYKYNTVICDIRMPGKSGIELAKEIKKVNRSIHVVLMSEDEKDYNNNENAKIYSDQFVVKPQNTRQVVELISKLSRL
jgi:DNA-binding NtrC family response regulator